MCNYFACLSCRGNFVNRCKKVSFESDTTCPSIAFGMDFAQCDTCHVVFNAISKLDNLVFNAPFLQTKGLSGLDDLSGWQRDELQHILIKPKDQQSWEDKAESRQERHELVQKLERMGLKGLEDHSMDHQGFDMAITPGRRDSQDSSDDSDKDSVKTL